MNQLSGHAAPRLSSECGNAILVDSQHLMDAFLPSWRFHRDELNRGPLAHEDWGY